MSDLNAEAEFVVLESEPARVDLVDSRPAQWLNTALFCAFCGLLFFLPLALGAVDDWSILVLEAGAALLFLLWAARELLTPRPAFAANPVLAPALAFGGVVLLQVLLRISTYGWITRREALLHAAYFLLMFVASQLLTDDTMVRRFAIAAAIFGFAVAVFALVQDFTSQGVVYWVIQPQFKSNVFGPYVNRNHYAGLMEMLAPLALSVAVLVKLTPGKRLLLLFGAVVMGGSVLLSLSRGGMLAFAAQMLLFVFWVVRRADTRRAALPLIVTGGLILAFASWVGARQMMQRATSISESVGTSSDVRAAVSRDGLRMAARRPLLGWGLGSFPSSYPRFRSFYSEKFINQAHNDWVQLLAETGILGFAAAMWFLFRLYRAAWQNLQQFPRHLNEAIRLGGLLGVTALLVHGFVDFNLHIPANAAIFYVLCAVAAGKPTPPAPARRRSPAQADHQPEQIDSVAEPEPLPDTL
ncbi:MAG TPA: O-antigen ligase family protein [Terriglobales bacterium]|nr:O-antigen ligase family protein [Terriglobales bacterium]